LKIITYLLLIHSIAAFFPDPVGQGTAPVIFPDRQGLEHPAVFCTARAHQNRRRIREYSIECGQGKPFLPISLRHNRETQRREPAVKSK